MLPTTMRRSVRLPLPYTSRYAVATRQFQTTPLRRLPKKDDQDKDSINTESTEYSKSGGDSAAARATEDAAFSKDKTSPEEQHEAARQEAGGEANNPLNVSPANPAVSQPKGAQKGNVSEGSANESGESSGRARTSGGGSPSKAGGGKSGGGSSG